MGWQMWEECLMRLCVVGPLVATALRTQLSPLEVRVLPLTLPTSEGAAGTCQRELALNLELEHAGCFPQEGWS